MPANRRRKGDPEITKDRRKDILDAAEELFSRKGFSGTTTRDLAARAGVHEAVLFRHFATKEELYRTILELKLSRNRQTALQQMEQCAERRDDRGFFEALARGFLARFEDDLTMPRLVLYSALEGYESPDVVVQRQIRIESPTLEYITTRIHEGAFRSMDPGPAVYAFGGMLFGYVIRQQILGMAAHKAYTREEIVQSFVSIFLEGMKVQAAPGSAGGA